jgi:predicted dehydrogenase
MVNSGGLALQKASHHFDFVNWLVGARPALLSARGSLMYYGKKGPFRGPRCSACKHAAECPRYADVFANAGQKALYQDVETVDGYIRDACVFGEEIDIPDTIHAIITYENGVHFSYALNAYAEFEGVHIAVEGTLGCLELVTRHDTSWAVGHKQHASKDSLAADGIGPDTRNVLMLYPAPETGKPRQDITPAAETGGHGGADPMLRRMLFGRDSIPDPLGMKASLEEGIQAVLIGIAVNESIRQGGRCLDIQTMTPALPPPEPPAAATLDGQADPGPLSIA